MSLTPNDTLFVASLHEVMRRRMLPKPPKVMWMGFDHEIHIQVRGHLFEEYPGCARNVGKALWRTLCYKAILYVQYIPATNHVAEGVIVLMGSRQTYSFHYDPNKDKLSWVQSDKFTQLITEQFPDWEEYDTTV